MEWIEWPFCAVAVSIQYGCVYAVFRWHLRRREQAALSLSGGVDQFLSLLRCERGLLKGIFLVGAGFVFVVLFLREMVVSEPKAWPFLAVAWIAGIWFSIDLAYRHHLARLQRMRA
ncbi:MAG: hypothetical protein IT428_17610 [Planctomycetaceae bacterium]|nr:hypothetical protein [Planctomycetaceae bacterium]